MTVLASSTTLDLLTILKVSQTLSSEIQRDRLCVTLLQTVLELTGATQGALALPREDEWFIEAIALLDKPAHLEPITLSQSVHVPHSVITTVKQTLTSVVIGDATVHPSLASDPYIVHQHAKSLLCTPILQQGQLVGIVYLEHRDTAGAFTSHHIELLDLLCTQAAISLENARRYQESQTYAQQLQAAIEKLQLSEARYHYLATATSQIIWLASPAGENLDTVHWMAYTGQTDEEVKGTGWLNALHPDDLAHTTRDWLNAVETKSLYETEYRIRGADGLYRYFAVRGVPLLAEDGSVKEWIGTCTDIDARRCAEDQLRQKSQELEQTLQELQTMQLQLVQNEKMSALGNLVAGVAHEINNPVGFLQGNIQPALDYINDLFGLIDLYQQKYPQADPEIDREIKTIDLEFVREDLPKLISSMQEGVDRIGNISTSLRTFSRADNDTLTTFDLHAGLDSTILILKHRLKANENRPSIKVMKQYGQIPLVECLAGQMNQVFMNILANAIDALEEANIGRSFAQIQTNPNRISITTAWLEPQNTVRITIQDNGVGIPESVKEKIFDHLFTTKAVGQGTGLGLAIARQIVVDKHHGTLDVQSQVGQGTEFMMELPVVAVKS